jgi:hypothetical protein
MTQVHATTSITPVSNVEIAAVSGSLRTDSWARALLQDLESGPTPPAVSAMRQLIESSDAPFDSGAQVVEAELALSAVHTRFDDEGRILDPGLATRVSRLLANVTQAAEAKPLEATAGTSPKFVKSSSSAKEIHVSGVEGSSAVSTAVLDGAYDEVSALDYEIPNPFVNHAPMACEALASLGFDSVIGQWVEHFEPGTHRAIQPVTPNWDREFPWQELIGSHRLLPEWMGYFERAIADVGWRNVVRNWVPRLMPGLVSALFHGVIRTAHVVRALDFSETQSRRAELARALGNWAVWYGGRQATDEYVVRGDPVVGTARAAARAAGCYVAQPNIVALHGVTGAMAVHLLSGYVDVGDAASALAQLLAEHDSIFHDVTSAHVNDADGEWDTLIAKGAVASFDSHQVKLVEACVRGLNLTGDPHFTAAARVVTGIGTTHEDV